MRASKQKQTIHKQTNMRVRAEGEEKKATDKRPLPWSGGPLRPQPLAEGRASMDEVGQTRLAVQRSET